MIIVCRFYHVFEHSQLEVQYFWHAWSFLLRICHIYLHSRLSFLENWVKIRILFNSLSRENLVFKFYYMVEDWTVMLQHLRYLYVSLYWSLEELYSEILSWYDCVCSQLRCLWPMYTTKLPHFCQKRRCKHILAFIDQLKSRFHQSWKR